MDELLNKEPVNRAQDALQRFDKSLKVKVLEKTARTAKDASLALGCEVGAIVKSLLFRAENSFILCLVSGDKKCSLNKLKKITQKNDLCMASPDQVKTQTGYTIGGVSPVGLLNEIEIFMDNTLKRFEILYAAAGHPNCIFEINFKKLNEITSSKVLEITE
jgi:Cys-tRNA(Pro) deacylase